MSSCFLRLCFFQLFPFPFPLLKFVSFYLASFFLESKPKAFQRISSSPAKKKHEWSWYTIVWFVWGYTIVSSCFLRFFFFQPFPFPFPLLKFVSFYLASFFLKSKPKAVQRISFSQAKKTWMIMIHNSMVCLRVHYCVQLLPEVIFFETFPLPFPLLKFVSFYLASFFLESKPKAFQRISFSQAKKNMNDHDTQ